MDVAWRAELFGWKAYYDAEAVGYHERGWKTSGRSGKAMFIKRISYINRYKNDIQERALPYAVAHSAKFSSL
ncbi:hypothetical protein ACFTAO_42820 [Paenibacillus rhizoplanae]